MYGEPYDSLWARNKHPVSLNGWSVGDKRILVLPEKRTTSTGYPEYVAPKAQAYVQAYLPGYSKDRARAVLRIRFGPSAHGASATFFLVKEGYAWIVRWRRLAYYA